MNADLQHFEATIREAVEEHGSTLDTTAPEFGALIAGRNRRTHRSLAAATGVVALIGLGGIVLATSRSGTPTEPVGDAITDDAPTLVPSTDSSDVDDTSAGSVALPPAGTMPSTVPIEYSCTDPIGEDQLGRQLFGSCEPRPDGVDGDFACVERLGTENGFVLFARCEPVGQLGAVPRADDEPAVIPDRRTPYIVQAGDYGIKVAAEFCVSIADLEAANGWTDNSREFPFPGSEILIPDGYDEATCDLGSYTITSDDTSRIGVAEKFCISVQALDAANIDTDGYSGFFPGLEIVIPPSGDGIC